MRNLCLKRYIAPTVSRNPLGLESLFDRFFEFPENLSATEQSLAAWSPAISLAQDEKQVSVIADIPGVDPKDVRVTVHEGRLVIEGSREESESNEHYSERRLGSFRREVQLPDSVDVEKINAEYRNGVVSVSVPLLEKAQPREIEVSLN